RWRVKHILLEISALPHPLAKCSFAFGSAAASTGDSIVLDRSSRMVSKPVCLHLCFARLTLFVKFFFFLANEALALGWQLARLAVLADCFFQPRNFRC